MDILHARLTGVPIFSWKAQHLSTGCTHLFSHWCFWNIENFISVAMRFLMTLTIFLAFELINRTAVSGCCSCG